MKRVDREQVEFVRAVLAKNLKDAREREARNDRFDWMSGFSSGLAQAYAWALELLDTEVLGERTDPRSQTRTPEAIGDAREVSKEVV